MVNVRVLMIMTVIAECIAGIIDGIARIAAQKGSMSEHWTIARHLPFERRTETDFHLSSSSSLCRSASTPG